MTDDNFSLPALQDRPHHLQKRLGSPIGNVKLQLCLDSCHTNKDQSRLRSLQGKGSGDWVEASPSMGGLALYLHNY